MSVPDRGNHPNRKATHPYFTCPECKEQAPQEHPMQEVCLNCEDEASNTHSSFWDEDALAREEDEFYANKDRDREEPKRPYGKSE
jgi:hypothetical protein